MMMMMMMVWRVEFRGTAISADVLRAAVRVVAAHCPSLLLLMFMEAHTQSRSVRRRSLLV